MENNIKKVRELLDKPELLCQLAEECNELGKAALKLRRVMTGTNPTPMTEYAALVNLTEELSDVMGVLKVLEINTDDEVIRGIQGYKMKRWVGRLEERKERTHEDEDANLQNLLLHEADQQGQDHQ